MTKTLLTTIIICVSCASQAQQSASEVRVNKSFRNTPVTKALKAIQKEYGVTFAYDNALVQNIIVSFDLKDLSITQSLERLLQGTALTFEQVGRHFVIVPKPRETTHHVERKNITISGKVIDAETGETLPQATIRVMNTNIATATNNDGYFSLLNIPNDSCMVEIMYIGYVTHQLRVKNINNPDQLMVGLQSDSRLLNEVVVLGEYNQAVHIEDLPGAFVFNPKSVANLPSLGEQDMSRTLQLLPGISATDESASGMTIRGSHSGFNLTLLDGITIYQQDHFFGAFSTINADIIKDVRVHKGMFDARYGGRASGVIDITTKNGNALKPSFNVKMNLMNLKASAEIPLAKRWLLFAAARRSFTDHIQNNLFTSLLNIASVSSDQIRRIGLETATELPTYFFGDMNYKLTFRPTELDVVSLSFYNSRDKMDIYDSIYFDDGVQTFVDRREEKTRWGNDGVSLRWGRQWTERFYSNVRISASTFFRRFDVDIRSDIKDATDSLSTYYGLDINNNISDLSYAINNEWSLNNTLSIDFGFEGTRQRMYGRVSDSYSVSGSIPSDEEIENLDFTERSGSWLHSIYGSATFSPIERLSATLGTRVVHYYNTDNSMYFEPRASLLYKIRESIHLKAGYGQSNQFITQHFNYSEKGTLSGLSENYWILAQPGDARYPVIKSDHATAGTTLRKSQYVFDAEVYYKFSQGVIVDEDFNSATTKTYGLDVMIQKTSGIHTGWISYSLGRGTQTLPFILNGKSSPSWQDQRHELKLVNMLTLSRLTLSSTVLYGSGKPFPKYTVRYQRDQNGLINEAYPELDYSNTSRLPPYFSVNISGSYKIVFPKTRELELGLSIHNLTDHENIKTRRIDLSTFDEAILTNTELPATYKDITLLGFSPSLFLNFSF